MIFNKLYKQANGVVDLIERTLGTRSNLIITYFNQHCFNVYNSNQEYKNLIDNSFIVFLDGIGIYLTLKLFGYKNVQRFSASDLNGEIFQHFSEQQIPIFLIGGKFSDDFVREKAKNRNLNVVGYYNGFFKEQNLDLVAERIKQSSARVIIVGMGVPEQEILASKIISLVEVDLVLCVGGFLNFYFESIKRAPKFIRNLGLEWTYRLFKEPARLWKRYLIGIPIFLYNIFKEYLKYKSEIRN